LFVHWCYLGNKREKEKKKKNKVQKYIYGIVVVNFYIKELFNIWRKKCSTELDGNIMEF